VPALSALIMADVVHLWELEASAEASFEAMCEASEPTSAAAKYNDAKDLLCQAIAAARGLGAAGDARRLEARLAHVKAIFRSQFP
jgi:hypothetical protein